MSEEQTSFVIRPRVTLKTYNTKNNPAGVLKACREAARNAGWSLSAWDEFSATSWACLTPDAEPEEMRLFMSIVRERFEVTEAPGFEVPGFDQEQT